MRVLHTNLGDVKDLKIEIIIMRRRIKSVFHDGKFDRGCDSTGTIVFEFVAFMELEFKHSNMVYSRQDVLMVGRTLMTTITSW